MLPALLTSLGLTQNELDLYELLLRLGEVPVQRIMREVEMKRPTVYKSLRTLERRGLITSRDLDKKIHFRPGEPENLLRMAEEQKDRSSQAALELGAILPHLTSAYLLSTEKPVVSTYEGVTGLQKIYDDQVATRQTIYALVNTAEVDPTLFKWLTTKHVKDRAENRVKAKVIVSSGEWSDQYVQKSENEFRTTILVSHTKFPFEHEVDIYGSKVSFINYKKGEALIGVVIDHPLIAKTMKAFFDLAWIGAETFTT